MSLSSRRVSRTLERQHQEKHGSGNCRAIKTEARNSVPSKEYPSSDFFSECSFPSHEARANDQKKFYLCKRIDIEDSNLDVGSKSETRDHLVSQLPSTSACFQRENLCFSKDSKTFLENAENVTFISSLDDRDIITLPCGEAGKWKYIRMYQERARKREERLKKKRQKEREESQGRKTPPKGKGRKQSKTRKGSKSRSRSKSKKRSQSRSKSKPRKKSQNRSKSKAGRKSGSRSNSRKRSQSRSKAKTKAGRRSGSRNKGRGKSGTRRKSGTRKKSGTRRKSGTRKKSGTRRKSGTQSGRNKSGN